MNSIIFANVRMKPPFVDFHKISHRKAIIVHYNFTEIFSQYLTCLFFSENKSAYYAGNAVYFPMFNPYPEGYYASPGDEIVDFKLDYNTDSFRCGRIREDYVVTLENRKRAPPAKILVTVCII